VKHFGQIRAARPDDTQKVGAITRAAYAKYVSRIGREPMPMTENFVAAIARGTVVVIEADGLVRGCLIGWTEPDAYFIESIAVDPAAQGQGLGRRLIDYAAERARVSGLRAVRLYTNAAMTENLVLYRRIGFTETHRTMENGLNRVYMRWVLP
jgi:ribosomal protein S18 acetylase RimI-like enzyme